MGFFVRFSLVDARLGSVLVGLNLRHERLAAIFGVGLGAAIVGD